MNPVRYIHPDAFRGLLVLEYLRLRSTQLHQLPPLQHIGHSLTYLGLTHSMKFAENHAQDISFLRKIKELDLVFNGLKSTPLGLTHIANSVRILVFRSNAIKSIASLEHIKFVTLRILHLSQNKITHLRPDYLIAPRLLILNLEDNNLVSLEEITQYSWGSSLPKYDYLAIHLRKNPWHCNESFVWMASNLYKFENQIIYAKPGRKPYIENVQQLFCKSPDARRGTRVVPGDIIDGLNANIRYLGDLAGKYFLYITWKFNLRSIEINTNIEVVI